MTQSSRTYSSTIIDWLQRCSSYSYCWSHYSSVVYWEHNKDERWIDVKLMKRHRTCVICDSVTLLSLAWELNNTVHFICLNLLCTWINIDVDWDAVGLAATTAVNLFVTMLTLFPSSFQHQQLYPLNSNI